MARDAANDARLAAEARAAAEALTPAAIAAKTAEQVAAGVKSTDPNARIGDETASEANARITQGYKDQPKPELTQEGEAAGATLEFVRTAAGGVGTYKEIYPIGTPIPEQRTTAYGNVYDVQGNLISGSGLKTPLVPGETPSDVVVKNAPPITKLEDLSPAQRRVIEANAGNELIPVKRDANGVITEYRKMDAQEYLTSLGGLTRAGYSGKAVAEGGGMSDEQYFGLLKSGGVEAINKFMEDKVRAGETAKLLARYKSQGMSDADAQKAVDAAWAEMSASYARGYEIDESGNQIPMYGSAGSGFFGTPSTAFKSAFGSPSLTGNTLTGAGGAGGALASDVFRNTLALFFGPAEMSKPWVNQLYKTVSSFYKSGSTAEEAFNMAVLESENKPEMADFVKRFKGIYALQKMKQAGKAVTVPTVAEYFATESKMGDILKASNLGDLANEDFLGDVLSKGVSATEFGNRITAIFDRIDTAPDVVRKTIGRFFPTLDRTQLAKALALGDKGAKQLEQELAGYEVLAGAGAQQLEASTALPGGVTLEQAQQIAKAGGTFASTLPQFGQIARARETEQKLAEISGVQSIGVSGLTDAVIGKSAKELKALEDLTMQEEARFAGKAGTAGSRALASQSRANRLI
jgi:hypothetical protein